MKVRDLIETLKQMDEDAEVILQKDPEGNGYSYLSGADFDCVANEEDYDLNVYSMSWTADEACMDEDEWSDLISGPKCVVLYPSN